MKKTDNQVNFDLVDYRHVKGNFDRVVSNGRASWKKFYKTYFKRFNLLKDDGIGLVHTIGSIDSPQPPAPLFKNIFFQVELYHL